jgi:hypothetical protein
MNTPEEFRLFARECIAATLEVKTEAERDKFIAHKKSAEKFKGVRREQ